MEDNTLTSDPIFYGNKIIRHCIDSNKSHWICFGDYLLAFGASSTNLVKRINDQKKQNPKILYELLKPTTRLRTVYVHEDSLKLLNFIRGDHQRDSRVVNDYIADYFLFGEAPAVKALSVLPTIGPVAALEPVTPIVAEIPEAIVQEPMIEPIDEILPEQVTELVTESIVTTPEPSIQPITQQTIANLLGMINALQQHQSIIAGNLICRMEAIEKKTSTGQQQDMEDFFNKVKSLKFQLVNEGCELAG